MRHIDSNERARMTSAHLEGFNDACNIYRATPHQDTDTGQLQDSFDSGTFNVACGLAVGPEFRNERGQVVTIDADAVLRLAASQGISVGDRVVARAHTYSVDGVQLGYNVQVIKLQEIAI